MGRYVLRFLVCHWYRSAVPSGLVWVVVNGAPRLTPWATTLRPFGAKRESPTAEAMGHPAHTGVVLFFIQQPRVALRGFAAAFTLGYYL